MVIACALMSAALLGCGRSNADHLVLALRHGTHWEKVEAQENLRKRHDPATLPALLEILEDPGCTQEARTSTIPIIGDFAVEGNDLALEALFRAASNFKAGRALSRGAMTWVSLARQKSLPLLAKKLFQGTEVEQHVALTVLLEILSPEVAKHILEELATLDTPTDEEALEDAAFLFSMMGKPALPILTKFTESGPPHLRTWAQETTKMLETMPLPPF